ncbi:MAG TPA: rhodanese family protein [Phycisphaerales bacterium]|nr:rhodanese family protein [Phycisphaerales bacterium]HMP35846.1 rhodanese family protein [Phycisphaerales bacterium]
MTTATDVDRTARSAGSPGANAHAPGALASPHALRELLARGETVLVDVREPDEHHRERIAGSVLLPLSTFDPAALRKAAPSGSTIVLYCRSGRRSHDAAARAVASPGPEPRIMQLEGGIEAWKAAMLPVEVDRSISRISIMRQVQIVVGACVLAGALLTWFVNPAFILVPAFFGAGLLFAGATGTCALAAVLGLMPWNRLPKGAACSTGRSG